MKIFSALEEYLEKRDVLESGEPQPSNKDVTGLFVIQRHFAEKAKEHFDLRFGVGKELVSFAVPKHKLPSEKEKILAIPTENHPSSYIDFEGEIKSGYGKGKVEIEDSGKFTVISGSLENLSKPFSFELDGSKYQGIYTLVPFKSNFLITKQKSKKSDLNQGDKILFESFWHTIKTTEDGYEYLIMPPGVVILPYRKNLENFEVLLRQESNPTRDPLVTVVSGRIDEDESLFETVCRELLEETGFDIQHDEKRIEYLGDLYLTKNSVSKETLYAVDVTGVLEETPEGDGSKGEEESKNFWVDFNDLESIISRSNDSFLCSICSKFIFSQSKTASFPEHPDIVIIKPNEFYKEGISEKLIYQYYTKMKNKILDDVKDNNVLFKITTDGEIIKRKEDNTYYKLTDENYEEIITGRTTEIHKVISSKTDFAWVDIDPHENVNFGYAKEITQKIEKEVKNLFKNCKTEIWFSGNRGFYVKIYLKEKISTDRIRVSLKKILEEFSKNNDKVTVGIAEKDQIRLDITTLKDTGSIKTNYSLSSKTGLVSIPVKDIDSFKKEDAKIDKITKVSMMQHMDYKNRITSLVKNYKHFQSMKTIAYDKIKETLDGENYVISTKVDGEISGLYYNKKEDECYVSSINGRIREDFIITDTFRKLLSETNYESIVLIGELYALGAKGEHIPYNKVMSIIRKPTSETEQKIRFAAFDILEANGVPVEFNEVTNPYWSRLTLIKDILNNNEYVHPILAHIGGYKRFKELWNSEVLEKNLEGIVIYQDEGFSKVKSVFDVDVVVIGVEKSDKHDYMGSLATALMLKDGSFVYSGNVGTGFDENERVEWLGWARNNYVVHDKDTYWVKPEKVVMVAYERPNIRDVELFKYDYNEEEYFLLGKETGAVLIKPRFVRIRDDKEVKYEDVRIEQIPDITKVTKLSTFSNPSDYLADFAKVNFIKNLIQQVDLESLENFFIYCGIPNNAIAMYDPQVQKIKIDFDSFVNLLQKDKDKIDKILVHEITHLVQDLKGELEVPESDIAENYFENKSEKEALTNEILFLKEQDYSKEDMKDVFSDSFVRFHLDDSDHLFSELNSLIEKVFEGEENAK